MKNLAPWTIVSTIFFTISCSTTNKYYYSVDDNPYPDPEYLEQMCQTTLESDDMDSFAPPPVQELPEEKILKANLSSEVNDVLTYINQERVKRGLSRLTIHPALNCAAQTHSNDIGIRKTCSHMGKDGSNFVQRVQRCGYQYARGEIIACGQKTARAAVDAWLKSPGHFAILSDPLQKYFGAGWKNNYWTVVFSRK